MNSQIGPWLLCAAAVLAVATLLVSLTAVWFGASVLNRTARLGTLGIFALLTLVSLVFLRALTQSDFTLDYVVRFTERALPAGYKFSAFWAGQEGSILLWGWMIAAMATVLVYLRRKDADQREQAIVLAVLSAILVFFIVMLLIPTAAAPFRVHQHMIDFGKPVADGRGLNPILQDPAMIIHPPILFVGYAGFTMPFVLMLASVLRGNSDAAWVERARPWAMVSWLFLGLGIVIGSWWAYTELGWGGYWGWDPVENASLLPWLTGTAMLHSFIGQRHRGMLKRWNVVLAALTFALVITATWITRSGVVSSVHTFGDSLVGRMFLGFLIATVLIAVGLVIGGWRLLRSERSIESLISRETFFLGVNVALVGITAVVLIGTLYPALRRWMGIPPQELTASFYNAWVLPLTLILFVLMAPAPLLAYGSESSKKFVLKLLPALVVAVMTIVTLAILGITHIWALSCAGVAAVVFAVVLTDFVLVVRTHTANHNVLVAALKVIDANHRRYGAHIVHGGIMILALGVAGSGVYSKKTQMELHVGQTQEFEGRKLRLAEMQNVKGDTYEAVEAVVILTEPNGEQRVLRPQARFFGLPTESEAAQHGPATLKQVNQWLAQAKISFDYGDKNAAAKLCDLILRHVPPQSMAGQQAQEIMGRLTQRTTEIGVRSTLMSDTWVMLAQWENDGSAVLLEVNQKPMVMWLWVGMIVMTIGGVFCMIPQFVRHSLPRPVLSADPGEAKLPMNGKHRAAKSLAVAR